MTAGSCRRNTETNASLLEVFARFLPDLKATFSIFDQPQIYLSWARRESLLKLGLNHERELFTDLSCVQSILALTPIKSLV